MSNRQSDNTKTPQRVPLQNHLNELLLIILFTYSLNICFTAKECTCTCGTTSSTIAPEDIDEYERINATLIANITEHLFDYPEKNVSRNETELIIENGTAVVNTTLEPLSELDNLLDTLIMALKDMTIPVVKAIYMFVSSIVLLNLLIALFR